MFIDVRDRDRAVCRGGADYLPLSPDVVIRFTVRTPLHARRAADFGYDWGAIHDN